MALESASTPFNLRSSSCNDSKKCSAALGLDICLAALSGHHMAPRCSNNYKPRGVVSVEYCSSWGRAQVPRLGGEGLKA